MSNILCVYFIQMGHTDTNFDVPNIPYVKACEWFVISVLWLESKFWNNADNNGNGYFSRLGPLLVRRV